MQGDVNEKHSRRSKIPHPYNYNFCNVIKDVNIVHRGVR